MKRTTTVLAGLAAVGLVLTACSSDKAAESIVEELIEQQGGGDVDLDLSDGELEVQTPEGEVKFDIDEDDGSVKIEVDGENVLDAQVNDDGEGSIEISGEDGEESLDISAGEGKLPDDWPAEIPTPDGMNIVNGSSFTMGDEFVVSVTGAAADEGWVEDYGAKVETAGFPQASRMAATDSLNLFYQGSGWAITVFGSAGDGQWDVVVSATVVPESRHPRSRPGVILLGMTHRVGPKGQVVIPKQLRDELGIEPGDEVSFWLHDGHVAVRPASRRRPLRGRFAGSSLVDVLAQERRSDQAREAAR